MVHWSSLTVLILSDLNRRLWKTLKNYNNLQSLHLWAEEVFFIIKTKTVSGRNRALPPTDARRITCTKGLGMSEDQNLGRMTFLTLP